MTRLSPSLKPLFAALDIARSRYAQLPLPTRRRLGAVLQLVPVSLRQGGTYRAWRARIAEAAKNPAAVPAQQRLERLALLRLAYANSPAYRERLGGLVGATAEPAEALLEGWDSIPVLTGAEVVAEGARLCTVAPERLDVCLTGGSSGRPVRFLLDRGRSPVEYAFVHEAWRRTGFHPGTPRAVFRGVETDGPEHMHYEPALAELRCSVFHLSETAMAAYLHEIRRRGIAHLHGYPSALGIFADFVLRRGGPRHEIRGIMPTSERLPPHVRAVLRKAFPRATIAPFYGLSEKVAFATEVPSEPDTYDFDALYGYTELVDDDGRVVVEAGRRGRIVSTGLLFRGMPLIRYETGDEAELVALPTPENGGRLRVRAIQPRHGHEYLIGQSGILVPLSAMLQVDEEILGVGEFQFFQDRPGHVTLRVVPRAGAVPDFTDYLARANRKAEGEITLSLDIVDDLPTTSRGKRKFIDQRLARAQAAERRADALPG
jgi:phenylacetate-CoA ligase